MAGLIPPTGEPRPRNPEPGWYGRLARNRHCCKSPRSRCGDVLSIRLTIQFARMMLITSRSARENDVDSESQAPSIHIRVVYEDRPDLIELETHVRTADISGRATAYASPAALRDEAAVLASWAADIVGSATVEAGDDGADGWFRLRFYAIDQAGHVVCHATLAARATGNDLRPESVSRLSVEVPTELGLVEQFARHLSALADGRTNEAVLRGVL